MLNTLAQSCDMTSREYLGDYKKKPKNFLLVPPEDTKQNLCIQFQMG